MTKERVKFLIGFLFGLTILLVGNLTIAQNRVLTISENEDSERCTVSPTEVIAGETTTLVFSYKIEESILNGEIHIIFPENWPSPQNVNPGEKGFVRVLLKGGKIGNILISPENLWEVIIPVAYLERDYESFLIYWSNVDVPTKAGLETFTVKSCRNSLRCNWGPWEIETPTVTIKPAELDHIAISQKEITLTAGEPQSYNITSYDQYGNKIEEGITTGIIWSVSSGAGGTWEENTYTSKKAGTWRVTANYNGKRGTATLTVNPASFEDIRISSDKLSLIAGESVVLSSKSYDRYGNEIEDITSKTNWFISPRAEGSWEGNIYTSKKAGTWKIRGEYQGKVKEIEITVRPASLESIKVSSDETFLEAGETLNLSSLAYDVYENEIGNVTEDTIWMISPKEKEDWTKIEKVYTPKLAGNWKIKGNYQEKIKEIEIIVNPTGFHHISIFPKEISIKAGESLSYKAFSYDEFGNKISDVTGVTSWSISSGAEGTWKGNTYTSKKTGTWEVTANHNGKIATASLTVNPAPEEKEKIVYTLKPTTTTTGGETKFTIERRDKSDNPITSGTLTLNLYSNSKTAIFRESPGGDSISTITIPDGESTVDFCYYDEEAGDWEITVFGEEFISASTPIKVNPGRVEKLIYTLKPITMRAGEEVKFTIERKDKYNNPITLNDLVLNLQSSSKRGVFREVLGGNTVSSVSISDKESTTNFYYYEERAGDYIITVSNPGLPSTTSTITVLPASLESIKVSSDKTLLEAGESIILSSLAYDKFGNEIDDVTLGTQWFISPQAGGIWKGSIYTSEKAGTWKIRGEYQGKTKEIEITVNPAPISYYGLKIDSPQNLTGFRGEILAYDKFSNIVTHATTTVELAVAKGKAKLYIDDSYKEETSIYKLSQGKANIYLKDEISTSEEVTLTVRDSNNKKGAISFDVSDSISPQIVAVSPKPNQTDVDVNSLIKITFNEPIDVNTFELIAPGIKGVTSYSDKTLIFTPEELNYDRSYSISIRVKDLAGNPLTYGWSFETEESPKFAGGGEIRPTPTPKEETPPTPPTPPTPIPEVAPVKEVISISQGGKASVVLPEKTEVKVEIPSEAIPAPEVPEIPPEIETVIAPLARTHSVVSEAVASIPEEKRIVGNYVHEISATVGGAAVEVFEKPVTLKFTYTAEEVEGLDEESLTVYYWDEISLEWIPLPTVVDTENKIVTATITHFTYYIVMADIVIEKPIIKKKPEEKPKEKPEEKPEEKPLEIPTEKLGIEGIRAKIMEILSKLLELFERLRKLLKI